MSKELHFIYRNADGDVSRHSLLEWKEDGHYLKGFSTARGEIRTFRKDRVVQYFEGSDVMLRAPYSPPPPKPTVEADERPQIVFTGFPRVQRAALEAKADANGLRVCKTVTVNLAYLCAGPNAGPAKVDKAMQQNVFILNEAQLHLLLATGELLDPDEIDF